MTELDDELVPAVAEIVTDLGKVVSVEEVTKTYDPDTGAVALSGIVIHSVKATPPARFDRRLVDGDLIRDDDLSIMLAKSLIVFVPLIGWKVTIDGEVWKILNVKPLYSGEQVCAYTLHLRR